VGWAPVLGTIPRDRRKGRGDLILVVEVAAAIFLLLLVAIFVPRPAIAVVKARFETGPCDPAVTSFVARAIVTLANSGGVDGDVWVRFYVDGVQRAAQPTLVPAHSTLDRMLSVTIGDCSTHRYSVDILIPSSSG
jgi:hypothetical protein